MQGVIKSYDPGSGDGVILCDTDFGDYTGAAFHAGLATARGEFIA